jgi:transposase
MLFFGMAYFDDLPDDPVLLKALLAERDAVIAESLAVIAAKDRVIAEKEAAWQKLKIALVWFQQRMFGKSSEKIPPSVIRKILEGCAEVFGEDFPSCETEEKEETTTPETPQSDAGPSPVNESEDSTSEQPDKEQEEKPEEEQEDEFQLVKSHRRRKGGGRSDHSSGLPRVEISHDLPEEERLCPCCGDPMEKIGAEETKLLDFLAPLFYCLAHARSKYVCKKEECQDETAPVMAPVPATPFYKSVPGPGLLAHLLVSKYGDHLPLTRQQKIYRRFGVDISVSTMTRWVGTAADFLDPLYQFLRERVLASDIIQTDDTGLTVLAATPPGSKKPPDQREPPKKSRMWTYRGDEEHPYVVFDVTKDWSGDGPARFLHGFTGTLQGDGYAGYASLAKEGEVLLAGCMAHARRYFQKAKAIDKVNAAKALDYFQQLYRVEKQAKKDRLSPEARLALRQEKSAPVMARLKVWLESVEGRVLPKGPMAEAITYAKNQWGSLTLFLTEGRLEIDNNASERELRQVVLGRNNWKFAASEKGARRAAVVYSVIASAVRNGIDPLAYLRNIFHEMPGLPRAKPISKEMLESFLPDRWAKDAKIQDSLFAHVGPEILRSLSASMEQIAATR